MQHPDEGTIHAWLDGELTADEVLALESHIAACPECSTRVAEARGLVAASSRIVSALDVIPGGVIPSSSAPIRKTTWYSSVQFRAAAGIVVVAGASFLLLSSGQEDAARSSVAVVAPKSPVAESTVTTAPREIVELEKSAGNHALAKPVAPRAAAPKKLSSPQVTAPTPSALPASTESAARAQAMDEVAQAKTLPRPDTAAPPARIMLRAAVAGARDAYAGLRLVRSDTSQASVRNVYEVRQGVEVALTETRLPSQRFSAGAVAGQPQAAPPAAPPAAATSAALPATVITWIKGDKLFTLMGALSKGELEAIRLKLPEEKR
jgi:hypothetical protein